jgi:hypothetical protein
LDGGGEWQSRFVVLGSDYRPDSGVRLQCFELLEAAVKSALDARLVTSETVKLGQEDIVVEQVVAGGCAGAELGFHNADAAEVPGGGDELVEEGLLEGTLGSDVGLESSEQFVEFLAIFRADEEA